MAKLAKKELKITPYPRNAKKHPDEQLKQIAASIKAYGWKQPIVVDKSGTIIVGHGRYLAWEKYLKGKSKNPWIIVADDLTPEQVRGYRLMDNKSNESGWDMMLALEELRELEGLKYDIELTGFTRDLLITSDEKDDIVPDNAPTRAKLGDLWQLGPHRVLCGDSTKKEDVERLMDGKKADMVFTDPPYNLAFNGGTRKVKFDTLINDDETDGKWSDFITESLDRIKEVSKGDIYMCIDWRKYAEVFMEMNKRWKVYNCIIWVKNQLSMGMRYRFRHEFIIYADTSDGKWKGGHSLTDVWDENKDSYKDYQHPTQKPVGLIVRALTNTSKADDIVLDLFLGSGSTLIAAEKTNRVCYGMEIDPKYVDVILKRWEDYTGKTAEKLT